MALIFVLWFPTAGGAIPDPRTLPSERLSLPAVDNQISIAADLIVTSFRTRDSTRLKPLLPGAGKIFAAIPSLDIRDGYFSGDQLQQILAQRLAAREFVECVLAAPPATEGEDRAIVRLRLVLRTAGSGQAVQLLSLLAREQGHWRLRELREQPSR